MISRRATLACLGGALAAASGGARPRRLWADAPGGHLGAPAPDGSFVTLVDAKTGDLAIREVASGKLRRLTAKPEGSAEFAYFSTVSPDGQKVAYAWFNREQIYELRVMAIAGGAPRILHCHEERRFVQPCAWTPDGRQILTLFFRQDNVSQIALVDAQTGRLRVLKSLDWTYPNKMSVSPEGRWIAFDDLGREGSAARDIFLLASDGSLLRRVVEHPAHDVFPLWTPAGDALLFLSNRAGAQGLWMQKLEAHHAPRLIAAELGRALPMGVTRRGDYFYALRAGETGIWIAPLDDGVPRPTLLAAGPHAEPEFSPDGSRLVFLTAVGNENFGRESRVLTIVELERGQVRIVDPKLTSIDWARFHPAGDRLLVGGSDRHGEKGLYQVEAAGGQTKPLLVEPSAGDQVEGGVFGESGQFIYYLKDRSLRRLDVESRNEHVIYQAPQGALSHLTASPDRKWLAFAARRAERLEILALPLETGQVRLLATVRGGAIAGLDWTEQGKALLLSTPSAPPAVWRIPRDGGPTRKLPWQLNQRGAIRSDPVHPRLAYASGETRTEIWVIDQVAAGG